MGFSRECKQQHQGYTDPRTDGALENLERMDGDAVALQLAMNQEEDLAKVQSVSQDRSGASDSRKGEIAEDVHGNQG